MKPHRIQIKIRKKDYPHYHTIATLATEDFDNDPSAVAEQIEHLVEEYLTEG